MESVKDICIFTVHHMLLVGTGPAVRFRLGLFGKYFTVCFVKSQVIKQGYESLTSCAGLSDF